MSRDVQVFDITQDVGMFATLTYGALLARACEEQDLEPFVTVSSPHYRSPGRGPDWFSHFFGHRRLQFSDSELAALRRDQGILTIPDRGSINLFARGSVAHEITNDLPAFSEARRLFDKYFFIREAVLDDVGSVARTHFSAAGQLGIHFRGTDHHHEYRVVDYGTVTEAAARYFPDHESVFIATDEPGFLAFARSAMSGKRVVTARASVPLQHRIDQGDNYQKGLHALTDCLLLSRCRALVKTPSVLSAWSRAFADDMDVVLVGKPYSNPWKHAVPWVNLKGLGYFPESLLYLWDAESMAENRVIAIVADPPE